MICTNCGKVLAKNAEFCTYCGAVAQKNYTPAPPNTDCFGVSNEVHSLKINKGKRPYIILTAVVVALLVMGIVVWHIFFDTPKFEMDDRGNLYCNSDTGGIIEIPTEYDNQASGFLDTDGFYGLDFEYGASLLQFVSNHSWVFYERYPSGEASKKVYCDDYTLEFAINGSSMGVEVSYANGYAELIHPTFIVYDGNKEIESFDSCNDMRNWLKNR